MTCGHQRPSDEPGHIECTSDAIVQSYVESEFCDRCPFHTEHGRLRDRTPSTIKGAGDIVATVAAAVGIKQKKGCGCGSRQAFLNRILPVSKQRDDRQWAVAVTAAPRQEQTLAPCVYSLRQAGWEPVIFAEPETQTVEDCETKWNRQKLGVWHNWIKAARWALSTGRQYIVTVQDDVVLHPDSRQFAESAMWPDDSTGFISLYTPKHYSYRKGGHLREAGINRIYTRSLWGACALVWSRDVLADVVDHRIAKTWKGARPRSKSQAVIDKRRNNPALVQNSDTAIGKILNSLGRSMWFVDPSPAQHIATKSTIGHGGNLGRRNCSRCADFTIPLEDQVPRGLFGCNDSMSVSDELWQAIREAVRPHHHTLEFGSGMSTAAFAVGASHVALEQDRNQADTIEGAVWCPVESGWYQWQPQRQYDVILVDGPWKGNRLAGLGMIQQAASRDSVIFIDDTHREQERKLAEQLSQRLRHPVQYGEHWARIN